MNKENFYAWRDAETTREIFDKLKKDLNVLQELIASGTYLNGELVNKDQALQIGRFIGINDILNLTYEDLYGEVQS